MKIFIRLFFASIIFLAAINLSAQKILLDNFEEIELWRIYKSDGVEAKVSLAEGRTGSAIRFDYDFTLGSGYGGIQKLIQLDLPENYQFSFYIKAESPNNNFEIKLLDKSGENVWWVNNRNYEFPVEWTKVTVKKRHISFAWGPTDNKELKKIDRIEFTIASFTGGKGSIFIDDLYFEPLPPPTLEMPLPKFFTSSEMSTDYTVKNVFDDDINSIWLSDISQQQQVVIDFIQSREVGGFIIDWDEKNFPARYNIFVSDDKTEWEEVYSVNYNTGERNYVRLKDAAARFVKIEMLNNGSERVGIKELKILEPNFSENLNHFFINLTKDFPRGYFPRYFYEEKSYWNIIGVNSDVKEALINEDGMIEIDKERFSIEPMLFINNRLYSWNEVEKEQTLEENYLPIPKVLWKSKNFSFQIKAFAHGKANESSVLYVIYTIKNIGKSNLNGKVNLLLRPVQVNPYYQWLNIEGGVSKISSIDISDSVIKIDNDKFIYPLTKFSSVGALRFEQGNLISLLAKGEIPDEQNVTDQFNLTNGVLSYDFDLMPDQSRDVLIAIPFYGDNRGEIKFLNEQQSSETIYRLLDETKKYWTDKITSVKFKLPEDVKEIINSYRANLAYILINRDNAGIQPGSRSYERSWIRDGSLTSSALLKNGITDEVKEFIEWYSKHQYESGKIPCVVDRRGPDPVPEHDSHGQYIFLLKQYFNFTKDTSLLIKYNDRIIKAVDYMKSLIDERSIDHFKNGNDSVRAYYGIMPESISHEGYSAKPMHSYWDNFFTFKGLKDAAEIQNILKNDYGYERIKNIRDKFKNDLYNSINLAVKTRNIDYIPGCVELGDFDPTSTTIAIYPCNELLNLPQPYARNTFDNYYKFFLERREGLRNWINYTPYEVRTIGSFIFLDKPDIAHELLNFFLEHQRPSGWNHWAEVVWKDERYPGFIGDMPHTWVGSDFINAVRAMFVYENEYDSSLVIAAGLKQEWIDEPGGISIENLPIYYGELSYSIQKQENMYAVNVYGNIELPPGNIVLKNFNSSKLLQKVFINGKESKSFTEDKIMIHEFPASVEIIY
jgi:hypothetical protein